MIDDNFFIYSNLSTGIDIDVLFGDFIQDFDLQGKRVAYFKASHQTLYALNNYGDLVGIVFVVKKFRLINNITWLVSPNYRDKGIASRLIAEAQREFKLLTALTRNDASYQLAKKMNFLVFFKKFCIWFTFKGRIPSTSN